ncbi:helix-turn-helix domain-containing protein [Agrilactobacillus fermenti]|uniref:helix-turn-helix domain-containing protein n=1 Tax=Agrilactobacillus fermenti TaxID=2586909 RepID=UPI001E2E52CF|nr:helix-turn-helix transcriptional regulator [Agrilactobacillus fermenti]MCD2257102.1 helix-turn-helix transcriptional regulator [Agrilactobacillus fermenti]
MFADKLKELRKSKPGLTQEALAKQLGIAKTTYSSYEQGKRQPDYEMLQKIANYFDVTSDYLLGINQTPKDATSREVSDLKRILEQQPLTYEKTPVTDKDREAIQNILIGYFWNKGRHRVEHDNDND